MLKIFGYIALFLVCVFIVWIIRQFQKLEDLKGQARIKKEIFRKMDESANKNKQ